MNQEKPVLATDWDDVCYEFVRYYFPYYNRRFGTDYQFHNLRDHDLTKLFKSDIEHILETIDDFHETEESIEQGLINDAPEVLPVLAKEFDIIVVTARKRRFKSNIQNMIDEYMPGTIQEIYLLEDIVEAGSKGKLAKSLGAVALVDDHINNIFSAQAEGVRGLLRNMPKNYYHPLAVERVNDWYDIYENLTGETFVTQNYE